MLLGHRYYDQSTGRFLSEDPARDGANWYAYCANNPLWLRVQARGVSGNGHRILNAHFPG